mgnify:CR=1 FL=1
MSRHICQVAFSALDGPALRDWYARVFGLVKSGKADKKNKDQAFFHDDSSAVFVWYANININIRSS